MKLKLLRLTRMYVNRIFWNAREASLDWHARFNYHLDRLEDRLDPPEDRPDPWSDDEWVKQAQQRKA